MEENSLKQIIQRNYSELGLGAQKTECPSEEILAEYLERELTPDTASSLESHLASCSACTEQVILLNRVLNNPETISPPAHLIEEAKGLVSGTSLATNFLEIILVFGQEVCQVIRTTGEVLQTAGLTAIPVSVRGESVTERAVVTKISKNFDSAFVEVHIEKLSVSSFRIKVVTLDPTSRKPLNDLRISLFRDRREMESLLTHEGAATFTGLAFSRYKLEVIKANSLIGEILLDLRKA